MLRASVIGCSSDGTHANLRERLKDLQTQHPRRDTRSGSGVATNLRRLFVSMEFRRPFRRICERLISRLSASQSVATDRLVLVTLIHETNKSERGKRKDRSNLHHSFCSLVWHFVFVLRESSEHRDDTPEHKRINEDQRENFLHQKHHEVHIDPQQFHFLQL
jgi:hypothetical protein